MKVVRNISDYIKPEPKQKQAIKLIGSGKRIFYGGARGGGKTAASLMGAVLASIQYPGLKTVCMRETYPELNDAFIKDLEYTYPPEIFKYKYRDKDRSATFTNGSRIMFRACDSIKAARKVQGTEFHLLIIDEAPNIPEAIIQRFLGSLRNARVSGFVPTLFMTGNPGGISDLYFKTRFINPDYKYWRPQELKYKDNYVFISAKVSDNPYVNPEYIEYLETLPENLRKAWLDGDWNVFEGQFFEEWNPLVHAIEPFEIPEHWHRAAGFDLGYTKEHPSVCLWGAQHPDTGEVFIYQEYASYSVVEQYALDIALRMSYEPLMMIHADPSMFNSTIKMKHGDESPGMIFLKNELPITAANNERVNGWRIIKQWMHWTKKKPPKLRIFNTCRGLIETIPILKYNLRNIIKVEDLDTKQRDDYVDALRYLMVSAFQYPTNEKTSYKGEIFGDDKDEFNANHFFATVPQISYIEDGIIESARGNNVRDDDLDIVTLYRF